jgi:cation diffusion facilitator family transporter
MFEAASARDFPGMNDPLQPDPVMAAKKRRVAAWSLAASGAVAILKFGAALATGSLGLLSEAFHSIVDFGATIITLVAVNIGDRPADDDHHFGHAKIESLAALAEIMLLFGIAAWFIYESVSRLIAGGHEVTFTWWAVAVLLVSIAVDYNRSRSLQRVADETSSGALAADASHFHSDMLGSAAVLIGLLLVWLGLPWGDSAAALVVAFYIGFVAWRLARSTIATLLDTAPEGVAQTIRQDLQAHPKVQAVRQLRVRPAGPVLFINAVVDVPRTMPVTEIADLKAELQRRIRASFPSSDILVAANPVELDTESVFEKSRLVASGLGHAIHHLTVQQIGGKRAVSFDVEFDGDVSLESAHEQATALEAEIRKALGGQVEVESHIEPLPFRALEGQEAEPADIARISKALHKAARGENLLHNIHNIRVRFTEGGHYVHYHCRFEGATTVDTAHDVIDRVERKLMEASPTIKRVVAHAEPLGHAPHGL